jgi:hypothetical protein
MSAEVPAPRDLIESVAGMRFPAKTDERLTWLMDRNNDGLLTPTERDELESLVELSESMSLIRAQALKALGRSPV